MQTLTPMTVDRRALHRIPELGDELPKTMDYVQDVLGTLDCEVLFPLDSAVCAYFDFGAADTLAFRAEDFRAGFMKSKRLGQIEI